MYLYRGHLWTARISGNAGHSARLDERNAKYHATERRKDQLFSVHQESADADPTATAGHSPQGDDSSVVVPNAQGKTMEQKNAVSMEQLKLLWATMTVVKNGKTSCRVWTGGRSWPMSTLRTVQPDLMLCSTGGTRPPNTSSTLLNTLRWAISPKRTARYTVTSKFITTLSYVCSMNYIILYTRSSEGRFPNATQAIDNQAANAASHG